MKIFHCEHCQGLIFFENNRCLRCQRVLAFLPGPIRMAALATLEDKPFHAGDDVCYKLCRNYLKENACNWALSADDPNPLCCSCRLPGVIPDLTKPEQRQAWLLLEGAKRRLIYDLVTLKL